MHSLFYISLSLIPVAGAARVVAGIVEQARARNRELGVTGALVFTGKHFAQLLEGEREVVDETMSRVIADPRHTDIRILETRSLERRLFDGWSLAYSGAARFLQAQVDSVLAADARNLRREVDRLTYVMREMHKAGGIAHRDFADAKQ